MKSRLSKTRDAAHLLVNALTVKEIIDSPAVILNSGSVRQVLAVSRHSPKPKRKLMKKKDFILSTLFVFRCLGVS